MRDTFNPNMDSPAYLAFSDGTVLQAQFDGEHWTFIEERPGRADVLIGPGTATLRGDVRWVVAGDFMSMED